MDLTDITLRVPVIPRIVETFWPELPVKQRLHFSLCSGCLVGVQYAAEERFSFSQSPRAWLWGSPSCISNGCRGCL